MTALLILLVLAFAVQAVGWAWVSVGLNRVRDDAPPEARQPAASGDAVPLSVIVAAHDEEASIGALLDALAAQTHQEFEVVIVDDRSRDATAEIVRQRQAGFPVPLRLVQVASGDAPISVHYMPDLFAPEADIPLPPKKNALTHGIRAASHDRLAFTDADCTPPPDWLATLACYATQAPEAVLVGYGPLVGTGLLGRFVRYETLYTAALSMGAVGHGRAWHAVGRNLSYTRSLWRELGEFGPQILSLGGDDDLFVQEAARAGAEVRYVTSPQAFVPSAAPASWRVFWRQRRRHAAAGSHYSERLLAALGAMQVSGLALWIGAPVLLLVWGAPWGLGLLAARLVLQRGVLSTAWDLLGARADVRLWHPLLDAMLALYRIAAATLGVLPTPKRW